MANYPQGLQDLYIVQLRDLYSAEEQMVEALPKMTRVANSSELQQALEDHLVQTRKQYEDMWQLVKKR